MANQKTAKKAPAKRPAPAKKAPAKKTAPKKKPPVKKEKKTQLKRMYCPLVTINDVAHYEKADGSITSTLTSLNNLHLYATKAAALNRAQEITREHRGERARANVTSFKVRVAIAK